MSFLSWLENISYLPGIQQPISLRTRSLRIPFRLKQATRIVEANKDRWYNEDGSIKAGLGRRDYRRALRFSRKLPLAELFASDQTPIRLLPKPSVLTPAALTPLTTSIQHPPIVPEEKQEIKQDLSLEYPKPDNKPENRDITPDIPKAWQGRMAQHAAILLKRYKDNKDFHFNDDGSYTNSYGKWIPVYVGNSNWGEGPNPGTVYININDLDAYNADEHVRYYLVNGKREGREGGFLMFRRGNAPKLNFKKHGGTIIYFR